MKNAIAIFAILFTVGCMGLPNDPSAPSTFKRGWDQATDVNFLEESKPYKGYRVYLGNFHSIRKAHIELGYGDYNEANKAGFVDHKSKTIYVDGYKSFKHEKAHVDCPEWNDHEPRTLEKCGIHDYDLFMHNEPFFLPTPEPAFK